MKVDCWVWVDWRIVLAWKTNTTSLKLLSKAWSNKKVMVFSRNMSTIVKLCQSMVMKYHPPPSVGFLASLGWSIATPTLFYVGLQGNGIAPKRTRQLPSLFRKLRHRKTDFWDCWIWNIDPWDHEKSSCFWMLFVFQIASDGKHLVFSAMPKKDKEKTTQPTNTTMYDICSTHTPRSHRTNRRAFLTKSL